MEGEGQGRTKRSQEGQEEDSDVMWDWVFPAGLDLKYGLYGLSAYGKDWSSDAAISSGGNDLLRHLRRKRAIISVFSEDEAFVRQIQIPFDRRQTCNWEPGNGICQGQEANAIHKLRSTSKKQSQPLACLTTVRQGSRVGTPNWLSVKTCYVITGFHFLIRSIISANCMLDIEYVGPASKQERASCEKRTKSRASTPLHFLVLKMECDILPFCVRSLTSFRRCGGHRDRLRFKVRQVRGGHGRWTTQWRWWSLFAGHLQMGPVARSV